jgi:hypothetical protein
MSGITGALCIGGVMDGENIEVRGKGFQAPIHEPISLSTSFDAINEPVKFKTQSYRAEPFCCGEARYTIYVVDGMTTQEAFEQLLLNYKRSI